MLRSILGSPILGKLTVLSVDVLGVYRTGRYLPAADTGGLGSAHRWKGPVRFLGPSAPVTAATLIDCRGLVWVLPNVLNQKEAFGGDD